MILVKAYTCVMLMDAYSILLELVNTCVLQIYSTL